MAAKPRTEMTPEELAKQEEQEFNTGPLSVLTQSVKNNTQVTPPFDVPERDIFRLEFLIIDVIFPPIGSHQLPKQQEAVGACKGFRSALQHGVGERQRALDRSSQGRKGQEKVQAGQQRPIYFQDVFAWRFRHSRASQSTGQR